MGIFFVKQNDTQPRMLATLKDGDGTVIDLTSATARFHMRTPSGTVVVDAAATVVNAAAGIVRYDWQAADTASVGTYQAEFEITYPDNTVETFPNAGYIRVQITDDIA
jgi:phage baseplate assembly protein gpV